MDGWNGLITPILDPGAQYLFQPNGFRMFNPTLLSFSSYSALVWVWAQSIRSLLARALLVIRVHCLEELMLCLDFILLHIISSLSNFIISSFDTLWDLLGIRTSHPFLEALQTNIVIDIISPSRCMWMFLVFCATLAGILSMSGYSSTILIGNALRNPIFLYRSALVVFVILSYLYTIILVVEFLRVIAVGFGYFLHILVCILFGFSGHSIKTSIYTWRLLIGI